MKDHELKRCLVAETQAFGRVLALRDFDHADWICYQMYFDFLGYGINERMK